MVLILNRLFFIGCVFLFTLAQSEAGVTPVSLGLMPPAQFPTEKFTITGLRLSVLWGKHQEVYGADVGLLGNITTQKFVGIAVAGGFNATKNTATIIGLQAAGGANINTGKATILGIQAALGANINKAETTIGGLQISLANLSHHTKVYGVQAGAYNVAKEVFGFQIGLVNVTESLHGLQIGLLNFHHQGIVGVSPIINVGF